MAIPSSDQPIETLRESTIDQLVMNYGHNKLSMEAFERRLEQAMDANNNAELAALTDDLELQVDQDYLQKKRETFGGEIDPDDYKNDIERMYNIMGGGTRKGEWEVPKEIRMYNVMGGGELDFSEAIFTHHTTKLKIYSVMGGASILVPDGVRVKSKMFSFMGGYDNRVPSSSRRNCPTLVIEGVNFMGGVELKVNKSYKQQMVDFGDSIRSQSVPLNDNVHTITR